MSNKYEVIFWYTTLNTQPLFVDHPLCSLKVAWKLFGGSQTKAKTATRT
jgi:hypothetical protein